MEDVISIGKKMMNSLGFAYYLNPSYSDLYNDMTPESLIIKSNEFWSSNGTDLRILLTWLQKYGNHLSDENLSNEIERGNMDKVSAAFLCVLLIKAGRDHFGQSISKLKNIIGEHPELIKFPRFIVWHSQNGLLPKDNVAKDELGIEITEIIPEHPKKLRSEEFILNAIKVRQQK